MHGHCRKHSSIEILSALRGTSYEILELAKSIILTHKYLKATSDTSAVRNANYVIIPRTRSHPPKAAGKKWSDEIILEIYITQPTEFGIQIGNMGITL